MAKYYCLGSTAIPTKKINQFISDVVVAVFVSCSFFLLKFLPLFRGQNASLPEPEDQQEYESSSFKKKNPVDQSSHVDYFEEAAKSSEMELRSTSSSSSRGGSHTRERERERERPMMISHTLSDLGSIRAEKEWRETLACKIFQERSSSTICLYGGRDGMDKLWEVYESSEEEKQRENRGSREEEESKSKSKNKNKNKKSRIVDYLEEEEEEGEVASLCCLKALKLSVGKMNFGMKISKAFKGVKVGWLNPNHHHHHHKKKMKKKKGCVD